MGYGLDFGALLQYLSPFLQGTAVTIGLTAVAGLLGVGLGIVGAALLQLRSAWVRRVKTGRSRATPSSTAFCTM